MKIPADWTPTADNINALPGPVRQYIHGLETMADPAGLVQDNALLKDQTRQLDAMIARLKKEHDMSNASNSTGVDDKCKTTVIFGYKVELELFEEDGEPRSDCSVTRTIRGIEYGGSLGMLMGFGSLEDYESGNEYAVADTHRDAIVKWAEANGY